jgi:hypothetical protein
MFSQKSLVHFVSFFLLLALMLSPASPARAASTIYVSTAGNDTSGDGSLANPFRTIGHALTIAASGDEIVLRGAPGVVNNIYAESIRIQQPNITIRSQSGEWAIIQCPTNDANIGQCVRFDVDSDGSRLQRVEVIGGYYYGIKLETKWDWGDPNDRSGASNILLEDVKVHDTARDAIKITPGCDDVTIRRAEIFNTGIRDSSNAEGIDNVNGDRMIVQDSYLHDIATNGIYFKGGSTDTLIERNRIERTGGAGILVGFDTSPEFFDLTVNPQYYESIRGVVRNNIIRNTQYAGIGLYAAKDAQIWNNTLIDTAQTGHSPIYFGVTYQDWDPHAGRPPSVNPILRNNLVYQSSNLPTECVFIRYSNDLGGLSALAGMPAMDYNLYFHDGSNCQFTDQRPTSPLDHGTFSQWQSHISGESHSLTSAPQLTADGHLQAGSPAIDAGVCAGAPSNDFDGDQRPQGPACDIGADEYYTGITPPIVLSITRADPNPTSAASVNFTVTFSEAVTGVDASDFSLTTTGSLSGAGVTGVSGSGSTYTVTVSTGTGSGTLRLDIPDTASITDMDNNPLADLPYTGGEVYIVRPLTATFYSIGAQDGWILESRENSNAGGSMDATGLVFNLGDDAGDRQYRAILSFNTAGLPDNATIAGVTLKIKRRGVVGSDPFVTHGNIMVDIRQGSFGKVALQLSDFNAPASQNNVGQISGVMEAGGWYSTGLQEEAFGFVNKTGMTQFRLRFFRDDDDDMRADVIRFFSSNAAVAYRPVLIVYYLP